MTPARVPSALPALPQHWATEWFLVELELDGQFSDAALTRVRSSLLPLFPHAFPTRLQEATALYNLRDYDAATARFARLYDQHPATLDGLDVYSNILYVNDQREALSSLAARALDVDRFRPEANCVVGNYFSLRGDHAGAIKYFDRAVQLDRNYLSAWTLIGHEFVELKNSPAAIQAYRRAVDLNPTDFRAWYGLGQTYEFLHQPYFALYYFKQAAALRPGDGRMWVAVGACLESLHAPRPADAMAAYQQAVAVGDPEGIALERLAKLHERQGDLAVASHCYAALLELVGSITEGGPPAAYAALFLAEQAKNRGDIREVERLCLPFMDVGGRDRERAKAILHECRAAVEAGAGVRKVRGDDLMVHVAVGEEEDGEEKEGLDVEEEGSDMEPDSSDDD